MPERQLSFQDASKVVRYVKEVAAAGRGRVRRTWESVFDGRDILWLIDEEPLIIINKRDDYSLVCTAKHAAELEAAGVINFSEQGAQTP